MPIKILLIVPGTGGYESGVEYHRLIIPYQNLNGKGFEISQTNALEGVPPEKLKDFQAVVFSRLLAYPNSGKTHQEVYDICHRAGCKVILDVDDYWRLTPQHLLYQTYRIQGLTKQLIECMKIADHVHTTTEILADEIVQINSAISVFPNAIDPTQPQWEIKEYEGEPAIGWSGGICHLEDILLLENGFTRLNSDREMRGRYKLFLCGFNEADKTGTWKHFQKIFTNNLSDKIYTNVHATNCFSYGCAYNLFNIALIPLRRTMFNVCKSELKMIEAGFMKKAVIVSDTMPYQHIARAGHNCMNIEAAPAWYHAMKKMIANTRMREDMAEQLYEDVQRYHIEVVNNERKQFYESL